MPPPPASRRPNRTWITALIRAPFSGVIVSKDAQVGEMVSPLSAGGGFTRTGIATIVDMNSNEIEVDVNEAYIARVKPGQKVIATLDAYPDWQIPSHVRTIIPTADRQKATVKVRISFDRLDPRILPDMGVKVAFLERRSFARRRPRANAPAAKAVIPKSAVHGSRDAHPTCSRCATESSSAAPSAWAARWREMWKSSPE